MTQQFHPEIVEAAATIYDEAGPKTEIVISTAIMVICSLISTGIACYRWRTEGLAKTATDAEVAEKMQADMNSPPKYDPETDTFAPKLVRQMTHQAVKEFRKKGEKIDREEAQKIAIAALRKSQQGATAAAIASVPPDLSGDFDDEPT